MPAPGPFLACFAGPLARVAEVAPTTHAIEFVCQNQSVRIAIYRRSLASAPTLSDLFLHEPDLPPFCKCHAYYSLATTAGVFIPLENLLVSLYQDGQAARPLMELLCDFRATLLKAPIPPSLPMIPWAAFRPEITAAGFYLVSLRTYGRRLTAHVGWICPSDRSTLETALWFDAGALEFRPRPNRTLDPGRWMSAATTPVATLMSDQLRTASPGAPLDLLTQVGQERLLLSHEWTPLGLMSKREARQARVRFVREHPDLWDRPRELASAMCQASLYSSTCNPHEVARYMGAIIAEARQTIMQTGK